MAQHLYPAKERALAHELVTLTWANPFSPERRKAEFAVLQDKRVWEDAIDVRAEVMNSLLSQVREFLERCRKKLVAAGSAAGFADDALSHYQTIVFLDAYHEFASFFDQVIEEAEQRGSCSRRIRFYDQFVDRMQYWFPYGFFGVYRDFEYKKLFAIFFQVRRAFYHIHYGLIGRSSVARDLRARIWQSVFTRNMDRYQRVLAGRLGDVITLITGPSGSGKELVARGIGLSRFVEFDTNTRLFKEDYLVNFYPLNLASLSSNLIESELFGHRKGAFTGALQDRKGYLEVCGESGTVFLDEIGEIDPVLQVKLLRILQTRMFTPIGDTAPKPFAGKLMAATNRDLLAEMRAGRFREDFFFRLNADRIHTPGLAEILDSDPLELETLVRFITNRFISSPADADTLTGEVCDFVENRLTLNYPWPGNFRELEQCVRNVMIHGNYEPPGAGFLSKRNAEGRLQELPAWLRAAFARNLDLEQIQAHYVQHVHAEEQGYEATARRLGCDRRTVKKYLLQAEATEPFTE